MAIPVFSESKSTVRSLREVALIEHIREWLHETVPPPPQGMGDDCAVVNPPSGKQLLTMDPVTYGRHFYALADPALVGAKLLKRNLSDIAAMGGSPDHALLGLTLSGNVSLDWLEPFVRGLGECAIRYGVQVVGGDVSEGPPSSFTAQLALTGHADRPLERRGGKSGNSLWVSGKLGGSLMGHHLIFEPRLAQGQWLARKNEVLAMMDLTDGLVADLPKLIPDSCAAILDLDIIPISLAAQKVARQSGNTALVHALSDGEDYELVFVLDENADIMVFQNDWKTLFPDIPLTCIGKIEESESQMKLLEKGTKKPVLATGFEHFS